MSLKKSHQEREEPSWNMMGDKFQLGPFKDVIVGVPQRVTRGTNFFERLFSWHINATSELWTLPT
ncbi:hypothetical protein ABIE18_000364 [Arthrobacter sp. 2762]|jgi:hypothetical protein